MKLGVKNCDTSEETCSMYTYDISQLVPQRAMGDPLVMLFQHWVTQIC